MQRSQETKQTEPPGHSRKVNKFPCFAADQALRTTDYLAACELQLLSLPDCQRTNPGWRCLSSTGKSQRLSLARSRCTRRCGDSRPVMLAYGPSLPATSTCRLIEKDSANSAGNLTFSS